MGASSLEISFLQPIGVISDKFDDRPRGTETGGDFGGESRGDSFFRGDVAVFGGLSYTFAGVPLTLIAEYESDQYDREVSSGSLESPPRGMLDCHGSLEGINLRASWLRGYARSNFSSQVETKLTAARRQVRRAPPEDLNAQSGLPEGYDPSSWYDRMLFGAEQSGLYLKAGHLKPGESKASMVVENREYNLTADAVAKS